MMFFSKLTIPIVITAVLYTITMAYVFRLIYSDNVRRLPLEKTENQMCADYELELDNIQMPTNYRTLKPKDLPPEDRLETSKIFLEDKPISRFPKALLLGFSKCGTTTLMTFMASHPDIVTLGWETHYFCRWVYPTYALGWYRDRMPVSTRGQVTVEKSPCYIKEPQALARIKAFNSSIKVMVIVRSPINRILSAYAHFLATNKPGQTNLNTTDSTFEKAYLDSKGRVIETKAYQNGVFTHYIEHLYAVLPKSQILILDGEAFVTNPLSQLRRVEAFLGVRPLFSEDGFYFDKTKGFYCIAKNETLSSGCMGKSKGRKHAEMDPSLKQKLLQYFRPHSERFFSIVGQRFDWE